MDESRNGGCAGPTGCFVFLVVAVVFGLPFALGWAYSAGGLLYVAVVVFALVLLVRAFREWRM